MQAWQQFLSNQENELGKDTTDKWLRSLKVAHFDACNLYLEAKDPIQSLWFEEHVRPKLKGKLFNNNHHPIRVHLTISEEVVTPSNKSKKNTLTPKLPVYISDHLDPFAILSHYVPGNANQIPFKLLCEIVKENSATLNPIYLYGPSGVGKSHLLMALAHAFKTQGARVLYVRTETFTDHVVSAIRVGAMPDFRATYRNVDVLLIDDVHEFARRISTQEELFHTFNTLHTARKQIILAGNKTPSELEEIEPRLISRFEWGISLKLAKLEPDELILILDKKLESLELSLTEDVKQFLITHFPSTPHALMRALETLILRAKEPFPPLEQLPIMLSDLLVLESQSSITPARIIQMVAHHHGLTPDDVEGRSQTQECAVPRQIAMYLLRHKLKMPYQKIGHLFARDHSTVMTSIKAIQKRIDAQDKELMQVLKEIGL